MIVCIEDVPRSEVDVVSMDMFLWRKERRTGPKLGPPSRVWRLPTFFPWPFHSFTPSHNLLPRQATITCKIFLTIHLKREVISRQDFEVLPEA